MCTIWLWLWSTRTKHLSNHKQRRLYRCNFRSNMKQILIKKTAIIALSFSTVFPIICYQLISACYKQVGTTWLTTKHLSNHQQRRLYRCNFRPKMKQILTKKTVILVLSFLTVFLTVCCQLLNSESPTKFLNENLDAVSLEASVNFSGDLTENFKSILVWNSAHRIETAAFGTGADIFYRQGCPESRCRLYVERDALPFHQYDAVLFHLHEIHLVTFNASVH